MKLSFYKYHGTGNDFILLDNRDKQFIPEHQLIARLCHRRFGIGADGLIVLNAAGGFDFGMKYYNSDGLESTMCGNGGRCIIAFADFLSFAGTNYRFLAPDGAHSGTILSKTEDSCQVKLSMNDVRTPQKHDGDFLLNTGSPHLVRFVPDAQNVDVVREGRIIRNHDIFQPAGINANFVEDKGGQIFVRTYERGVEDETLSCGTGVTASALVYAASRKINEGIIPVLTRGGNLNVHFRQTETGFSDIFLEGPAIKVYHGTFEINT